MSLHRLVPLTLGLHMMTSILGSPPVFSWNAEAVQAAEGIPDIPAELLRRYMVVVKPQSKSPTLKLRDIGARHVGQLVSVKVSATPVSITLL